MAMTDKKRLACPCGNTMMRMSLTDSGSLEIECHECGSVMTVGAGICPSRLEPYSLRPE
jgi:transcription initiation factor IIE alpha subunit